MKSASSAYQISAGSYEFDSFGRASRRDFGSAVRRSFSEYAVALLAVTPVIAAIFIAASAYP